MRRSTKSLPDAWWSPPAPRRRTIAWWLWATVRSSISAHSCPPRRSRRSASYSPPTDSLFSCCGTRSGTEAESPECPRPARECSSPKIASETNFELLWLWCCHFHLPLSSRCYTPRSHPSSEIPMCSHDSDSSYPAQSSIALLDSLPTRILSLS